MLVESKPSTTKTNADQRTVTTTSLTEHPSNPSHSTTIASTTTTEIPGLRVLEGHNPDNALHLSTQSLNDNQNCIKDKSPAPTIDADVTRILPDEKTLSSGVASTADTSSSSSSQSGPTQAPCESSSSSELMTVLLKDPNSTSAHLQSVGAGDRNGLLWLF